MDKGNEWAGKVAAVTGANGALGRAVVTALTTGGARVLAVDVRFDGAAAPGVTQLTVDLTDAEATGRALGAAGDFDVLCNIAGGFTMGEEAADAGAHWQDMFRLNVETLRNAVRVAVPMMKRRGRGAIVNVGALSAREGRGAMSAYCASKSTVMRLTESLAQELRGHGINVNAVLPSIIDTPANRADMPDADFTKWVSTQDLARVICFLASDAARAVHGALVPVTGLS